jgi:hypothetical protein
LLRRWEQAAIRQQVNRNPKVVIAITAASVFILLVVLIWLAIPGGPPEPEIVKKGWFYDLNSGKLFSARYDAKPPIKAPSGPLPGGGRAGVKAYVLTYVDEPNESQRFIAFLETTRPDVIKPTTTDEGATAGETILEQDIYIRTIEDANWVPADSPQGRAIIKEAFEPDLLGRYPKYYLPK